MRCMAGVSWPRQEQERQWRICACFEPAACDEGGPGFVNASVRTVTARETSWNAVAEQMPEHASTRPGQRGYYIREGGTNRIMGSPSCSSNGGTVERGPAGVEDAGTKQELETREHQKKVEDAKRICRIVHENDKSKGLTGGLNHLVPRNAGGAQWTWKKVTLVVDSGAAGNVMPRSIVHREVQERKGVRRTRRGAHQEFWAASYFRQDP